MSPVPTRRPAACHASRPDPQAEAHRRLVGGCRSGLAHRDRLPRRRRHASSAGRCCVAAQGTPAPKATRWASTPTWARKATRSCRSPHQRACRGSRRGPPTPSPNGRHTAGSRTPSSPAALRPSTRPFETAVADTRATTSCTPSTGGTGTARIPRCVSFTASWDRRTCSTGCSSRCRGSTARATTYCFTRCRFTAGGPRDSPRTAAMATSPSGWPGLPRRWRRRCTTSGPSSTTWSTPASTGWR